MKIYWGSGGAVPRIHNLGTRWRWMVIFSSWLLYTRLGSTLYVLDMTLGVPQSQSGPSGDEKEPHHCPCRDLNTGRPARSLGSILTELSKNGQRSEYSLQQRHKCNNVKVKVHRESLTTLPSGSVTCHRHWTQTWTTPRHVALYAPWTSTTSRQLVAM
jgi:hypothetical protein